MKLILPAILNPISRRKDKSVKLSVETRELTPTELISLMNLEGSEGWLQFSPNEKFEEVPEENANVENKSKSQRLRAVLFLLGKQQISKGKYLGLPENYVQEIMEKIIESYKQKLED